MQRIYFDVHTALGRKSTRDLRFPYKCADLIGDMEYYRIHGALFRNEESTDYNIFEGNKQSVSWTEENDRLYTAVTLIPNVEFEWDEDDYYNRLNNSKIKAVHLAPKKMKHLFSPGAMKKCIERIATKGLPVIMSATETGWNELELFLEAYPELKVILTDTSWGGNRSLFSLLERYPGLYFEISSNQANDILEITKQYFGIERVMFGSNYPYKIMGGLKALVEYSRLTESEKNAVACDNACRVLNIDKTRLTEFKGQPLFDEVANTMDRGEPLSNFEVIDAHAHMAGERHYSVSDLIMKNSDAKSMVQSMNDLGIDLTLTVPWEGISINGTRANETCVKAMNDYPGRFLCYASCNPNYSEELDTVIPEFHEKNTGFIGVKPYYPKHSYDVLGERYKEWFEYANKRKMLMLLHTGVSNIHLKIPELCKRYPDISILLAHSASSYDNADLLIDIVNKFDNAYLEITYTSLTRGIIEYMVQKSGADKVIFGTDTPMRDPAPQLAWIAYARISIDDKQKIMGKNIKRLLNRIKYKED